ncbi:hypothetical protein SteCoe_17263 [Stentor coeruleus]|uniref:Major facilitator superfamily (MFS) profile domain-containing protein n=1 Tax=Stentor coeruleus TaxID=5963 RepID=A0A1R2BZJ5_9CILI|nr:hypothetical protein SteCoe_17263 [Stentor coeruleus]
MVNRKTFTFLGCSLTFFIFGTMYCIGNIMPYIVSYIRLKDNSITIPSMTIIFYICMLTFAMSFPLSNLLQKRFRAKKCIYIGSALYITVVYIAAALQDRISVIIIYGVILGLAIGIAYPPALMIAISCYPERKGLIVGITEGIFSSGTFFFNFIATAIVNPKNKKPVEYTVNGKTEMFFEREIAENVPKMFLILASIYLVVFIIGILLIEDIDINTPQNNIPNNEDKTRNNDCQDSHNLDCMDHKDDGNISKAHTHFHSEIRSEVHSIHLEIQSDLNSDSRSDSHSDSHSDEEHDHINNNENGNRQKAQNKKTEYKRILTLIVNPTLNLTIFQVLKTVQFHQIFWGYLLSAMTGLVASASFKSIGIKLSYDDTFLTIVGSVGSIMNGAFRPLWGIFFDKTSFKIVYMVILFTQIVLCFTFPNVNNYKAAFLIWIVILMICSGGHSTILAPVSVRIYNREAESKVFSIFMLSVGISCLIVYFIQVNATEYLDPNIFFYIVGGLSCCSFISTIFFTEILKAPSN